MDIDKFLETHLYLYNHVCFERRELEAECARYRRLLKPWHFPPVASQDEAPKEAEAERKGPGLAAGADQHDEKDVKLINTVLAKAEKARNRHSKIATEETNENAIVELRGNIAGGDSQRSTECTIGDTSALGRGQVTNGTKQTRPKPDSRNISMTSSQAGVITQSRLNQLVKKTVGGNQTKRTSAITAVHSKAPFKTEPDRVLVRRGSALRKPLGGHAGMLRKGSADQGAPSGRHEGVSVARHRTPSDGRDSGSAVMTRPYLSQEETEDREDNSVHHENQTKATRQDVVSDVCLHTSSRTELDSSDTKHRAELQPRGSTRQTDTTNRSLETSQEPSQPSGETKSIQRFDLLRDGSKLVIPTKVRRLFSHNHHLRKKLFTHNLTVKVDTVSQKQSFLDKLNQQVVMEEKVQLGEAVNKQLDLHRNLLEQLNQLELNQLSAALPNRDVLRKKMVLEMILMAYREAGGEVTLLAQGLANNDPDICDQIVDLPVSPGYRCGSLLSGDTGAAGERLHYRKETDLLKYIQLQHAIKLLEVHKPIVTHLLEFILPELQQTANQTPHSAIPLYRAIYALLSHPAVQPPTVVMDTSEES